MGLSRSSRSLAVAEVHTSVAKLNSYFVSKLVQAGLPAVGISPFVLGLEMEDQGFHADSIPTLLNSVEKLTVELCCIPVIHGDVAFNVNNGLSILSGDIVLSCLAERIPCISSVFLTDVDGLYDRPPSNKDAKLIKEISVTQGKFDNMDIEIDDYDVTGGMANKFKVAAYMACHGKTKQVYIVNSRRTEDAIAACFDKIADYQFWTGTRIHSIV